MSLLQDVLRSHTADSKLIERKLSSLAFTSGTNGTNGADKDDDDYELVGVVSLPGSPARTRPPSPTKGASARPLPGPLLLSASSKRDPLKAFPTEISQRIFGVLSIRDLARCSRVNKKWNRSQTLNYVWFQHYRKENFHDDSLPPGKWTKRESKQNWRMTYLQNSTQNSRSPTAATFSRSQSGYVSPSQSNNYSASGYQTPRELKEEKWRQEAEQAAKPGKVEMRGIYKELGGRKSKTKTKLGSSGGVRDKGGWAEATEEW